MKKLLLSTLALAGCMAASAQDQPTMSIDFGDGHVYDTEIMSLQKITFEDGHMILHNTDESAAEFAVGDVQKIIFKGVETSIKNTVATPESQLAFAFDGQNIRVSGLDKRAGATVCSTSGTVVARQTVENGQSINVAQLAKGVYVLSVNGKTFKFAK